MAEDPKGGGGTPPNPDDQKKGSDDAYTPPSRDEWEKHRRHVQNLEEEKARRIKKDQDAADLAKKAEDDAALKRGEHERLLKEKDALLSEKDQRIAAFEKVQTEQLEELMKGFSEEDKALVPSSLPIDERLRLAQKLQARLNASGPKGSTKPNGGRDSSQFGGYSSEMEFAQRNPSGYLKWKKEQKP